MSTISYKGYQGTVTFEDDKLVIRVLHVRDFLVAECERATKVEAEFREMIEEYLSDCEKVGKEPDKPFKGSFNVRIQPDLHRAAALSAGAVDKSLNSWVEDAITRKLTDEEITKERLEIQIARRVGEFLRDTNIEGARVGSPVIPVWSVRTPSKTILPDVSMLRPKPNEWN